MTFPPGSILTHRKGGTYTVILTPDLCTLEETREPAYAYLAQSTGKIHVRRQSEMEDGRFRRLKEAQEPQR
jgi:hypothetical protein